MPNTKLFYTFSLHPSDILIKETSHPNQNYLYLSQKFSPNYNPCDLVETNGAMKQGVMNYIRYSVH